MSEKHCPLRWVKTVTESGTFVDMVAKEGSREYVITRNDGETFSARMFQKLPEVINPNEKHMVQANLKHRVSLEECIEDCEGYEKAINPPPNDYDSIRKERTMIRRAFDAMHGKIGIDVMTRSTMAKSHRPNIGWSVRSEALGNGDWHFLTPDRENEIIGLVESECGFRISTLELVEVLGMYRALGIDYNMQNL